MNSKNALQNTLIATSLILMNFANTANTLTMQMLSGKNQVGVVASNV